MTNCFSHMKLFAVRFFHITFIFVKGRQMLVLDYSYLNLFSLFALPASHKNNPAKLVVKSKPSSRVCMFSKFQVSIIYVGAPEEGGRNLH